MGVESARDEGDASPPIKNLGSIPLIYFKCFPTIIIHTTQNWYQKMRYVDTYHE